MRLNKTTLNELKRIEREGNREGVRKFMSGLKMEVAEKLDPIPDGLIADYLEDRGWICLEPEDRPVERKNSDDCR